MTEPGPGYITEEFAKELRSRVRQFREEWARFAVDSRGVFDAFREKGASLPEDFLRSYESLIKRKAELAESITISVHGIDAENWQPPLPTESLHEFEQKIEDLIGIAKELARGIEETNDRVIEILTQVITLRSSDEETSILLSSHQQAAQGDILDIRSRPARLCETSLLDRAQDFTDLLKLAGDFHKRQSGGLHGAPMSAAECREKFAAVSQKFGLSIAIEALRSGLGINATQPGTETARASAVLPPSRPASGAGNPIAPADDIHHASVLSARATTQQIHAFVNNFQNRSSALIAVPRSPPVRPHAVEVNPVSLSELEDAANQLQIDAEKLFPGVLDLSRASEANSPERLRALGLASLSVMIKVISRVFKERQTNNTAFSRNLPEILQLLAETQSAVRVEAATAGRPAVPQQLLAFTWLRYTCDETHGEAIHIPRFMRLDDGANPGNNPEVALRVHHLRKQVKGTQQTEKHHQFLRELCQSLKSVTSASPTPHDIGLWNQVDDCITRLIHAGVKSSDVRIRESLLPVIDELPEIEMDDAGVVIQEGVSVSTEFQQVIRSIYDYITATQVDESTPERDPEPVIEAVANVRSRLRGKLIVVVGGIPKPHAAKRLKSAFHLKDVRWLEATKTDRVSTFRPDLQGAAVVVLITRLMGHKHNDIRDQCAEAGIPCVQLPKASGYHPNSVALEIMNQVSLRIAG